MTEIERNAAAGHKSVMMTYQPDGYNLPWLADPHWDPIWNATQDAGLPITFHIDAGREMNVWPGYDPATNLVKLTIMGFLGNTDAISEVIFSGLCHRYPDLDFVSVESGIGYIPYLLESMDWQWINLGLDKAHPERDLLPSEYFRRQVYGSFWFEQDSALRIIDLIQDNVMYETDFPHPTSITPGPSSSPRRRARTSIASSTAPASPRRSCGRCCTTTRQGSTTWSSSGVLPSSDPLSLRRAGGDAAGRGGRAVAAPGGGEPPSVTP